MEDIGENVPLLDSGPPGHCASESFFSRHWKRWIWNNGPFLVLLSTGLFTVLMILAKLLAHEITPFEMLLFRGIVMCTFSIVKAMTFKSKDSIRVLGGAKNMVLLTVIGSAAYSASVALWYALHFLPIADVSAIVFSNTVLTSTLAFSFGMETWTRYTPFGVLFSVVGVVMVTRPPILFPNSEIKWTYSRFIGLGLSVLASVLSSLIYFLSKGLGKKESAEVILLWQAGVGLIFSSLVMVLGGPNNVFHTSPRIMILVICAAVVGLMAWILVYRSISLTAATIVSILGTLELVGCYLANNIIFGEPFSMISIVGGIFIGLSSVIVGLTIEETTVLSNWMMCQNHEKSGINMGVEVGWFGNNSVRK